MGIPFLLHIEIGSQRHYSDSIEFLQIQQFAIAGNDKVRAARDRAFENAVVRIVSQQLKALRGREDLAELREQRCGFDEPLVAPVKLAFKYRQSFVDDGFRNQKSRQALSFRAPCPLAVPETEMRR